MSAPLDSITIPPDRTLDLTKATLEWADVQRLLKTYFPEGLTLVEASRRGGVLDGKAVIGSVSIAVEATFTGSGATTSLELRVPLGNLVGGGSRFKVIPSVTFKMEHGEPTIAGGDLSVAFDIKGFDASVSLLPGFQIQATLKKSAASGHEKIDASKFTERHSLGSLGTGLHLDEIGLRADPWGGSYALTFKALGNWEIIKGCDLTEKGCDLTEVSALVLYSSEVKTTWAALTAFAVVGGRRIVVKAAYDGSVSGWQFEGGTDEPINIEDFVKNLKEQFQVPSLSCPESLKGATIFEIVASFNTTTQDFLFRCETKLPLPGGYDQELDIVLVIDISAKGKKKSFRGTVTLGSLEFDLILDKEGKEEDQDLSRTVLLASYFDAAPQTVTLGTLIATLSGDQAGTHAGDQLSFSIRDALFAYEGGQWLLAAGVEAGMDLSGLPLVGASFPPGQGARLLLQPLLRSNGLTQETMDAVRDLVPAGGLQLPTELPPETLSLATRMVLGADVIQIGLPVHFSDGKMADSGGAPIEHDSAATSQVDNVTWVPVQKAFGPVHVDRIGVGFSDGRLDFLLDGQLSAGGLMLALQGFGASVPIADPALKNVALTLHGIGIDFRSASVEIGGSLLRQHVTGKAEADAYFGTAIVKASAFTLEALGLYEQEGDHRSLFLYAKLDYLIGGPAFFFVTGLAAAFGYNRAFKLPPIERLAQFPLLAKQVETKDYGGALDQLRQYIPADLGAVFLGVGVSFTSFKTVESSALLTASFGKELALDLIGRSTLIMPVGAERAQAVAFVEMAWLASFRPAEGLLALRAQLSPESYIFSKDCHLTGGFAFYSWFPVDGPKPHGADERAGDFVLTLGGYHPDFDLAKHPHYPQVPRLAIAWRVDEALSIKGDAYYALTSSAAMAGGHLEAVWERHPYKVWFKAGIDFLFEWKPLHYEGEAYVELGASYTFQFCGTRHITAEVGADVKFWGPPFSGVARVDMVICSFDVRFGMAKAEPKPVHLHYDYVNDGQTKGFLALLPDVDATCGVAVKGGLVGTGSKTKDKDWVINPKELCLVVDSAIPSKVISVTGVGRDPGDPTKDPRARFGVAPMAAQDGGVTSATTVTIRKKDPTGTQDDEHWKPTDYFQYRLRTKGVPTALWGESTTQDAKLKGETRLIEALAGVEIMPKGATDTGTKTHWPDCPEVELFDRHTPTLPSGTYSIEVKQTLTVNGEVLIATAPPRRFQVAGEQFSLPPAIIHSVFPPEGSLGDHSEMLPQVILERSTLPWERSAGGDGHTPWLALLVFAGEMKATVLTPEAAQREGLGDLSGSVSVIEVKKKSLPSAKELQLLSHVRVVQVRDGEGNERQVERAVVVAKRAPAPGKRSTVHLVSMEKQYASGSDTVRLVSLLSWSFSCTTQQPSFEGLLKEFRPESCAARSTLLKHSREDGTRAETNYHGPLAPFFPTATNASTGKDISYAAAAELGRLLTLQSKAISVGLFRFKRSLSQHTRFGSQRKDADHLYPGSHPPEPVRPVEIERWIEGLRTLEGVPFRYLLPDEKLLPVESMRFFRLDEKWIDRLLAGALAVGGGVELDVDKSPTPFTGIVMRSQVVGGWPSMIVEAFDKDGTMLRCRRSARLSKNILMVLFEGTIERISLGLPKEALHLDLTKVAKDRLIRENGALQLDVAGIIRDWPSSVTGIIADRPTGKEVSSAEFACCLLKDQDRVEFKAADLQQR